MTTVTGAQASGSLITPEPPLCPAAMLGSTVPVVVVQCGSRRESRSRFTAATIVRSCWPVTSRKVVRARLDRLISGGLRRVLLYTTFVLAQRALLALAFDEGPDPRLMPDVLRRAARSQGSATLPAGGGACPSASRPRTTGAGRGA